MTIKPLPRPVNYEGRATKKNLKGFVTKEVYYNQLNTKEGDFRKVIQLVVWSNGKKEVRFGYYVKDSDKDEKDWRWGSQTTFTLPLEKAKILIEKAKKEGIL